MGKVFLLIVYFSVLLIDLLAVYLNNETIRYITKPLLMPLLVGYFVFMTRAFLSPLKKWLILALLFSWIGDILLMFEFVNAGFFIFGLVAFLIAHVFYIFLFEHILRLDHLKKNYWFLIPVLVYYIALIYLLSPHLKDMAIPVRVYGLVISYMLVQALQTGRIPNRNAAILVIAGAVLFIISDSMLAINKFYRQFEYAGLAVMLTYAVAQLLITLGITKYISSMSTHKFVGSNLRREK